MSSTKSPDSAGSYDGDADESPPSPTDDGAWLRPLGIVAAIVIVIDQLTKIWAVSALEDRTIDLFWTLRLKLFFNTGFSFGLGAGLGRWLAVLIVGVIVAVVLYARRVDDRRMVLLLGGIVGGAIGNLIDRVFRADDGFLTGGVVDFIDFQWWPIFNIADSAVVLCALVLVLLGMREPA